jgi:hypothetical protein
MLRLNSPNGLYFHNRNCQQLSVETITTQLPEGQHLFVVVLQFPSFGGCPQGRVVCKRMGTTTPASKGGELPSVMKILAFSR